MSRLPDTPERRDRAVSAVVGFVLIFGILVITFSLYQAQVVPQQNSQVEFEQHQEIQQQMVELRSNIVSMQGSTSTLSTAFDLGVRYPSRTIFVNPGPASGSLRTKGASDPDVSLTLRNVTATDSDETGDFWDGSDRKYNTSIIEYEPDFNRFQGGLPVVYEHSLIYNRVENGDSVPITDQSLINGNRINLIALNGTLAESGVGAESVDLEPVSTRTRVVEVNNKSGPITLEFASLLNADVWNETLENELVENGGHVQGVTSSSDGPGEFSILELKLKQNQDYELKLSKVGLGTGATNTDAEYLTEVEGAGATVLNDSTQKLTVEARDRFNGPQSGVTVEAAAERGTFDGERSKGTDSDGQATFVYDPDPDSDGTYDVYFTIDSEYTPNSNSNHDTSTRENVTMSVKVTPNSGSGGGGGGAYKVRWDNSQIKSESGVGNPNSANRYNYSLESGTLNLTMSTDPVADSANVEYAVNDTSIASLNVTTGVTDASGENVTKLQPKKGGLVRVYTSSGGSGDEIQIRVLEPPEISNFAATNPSGQNVSISFDSDEQLSTISVDLSGPENATLTESDFGETNNSDGTYTYTNTTTGLSGGDYTATLETAEDAAGNNGSTGESDTVTVGGSAAVGDGTLVYQSNNNKLSLITGNNSQVNSTGQNPAVIGQPGTGLSSDGTLAIPYLDNKPALVLAYLNGSTKELVGKNDGSAPRSGGAIATGVFNESGESVFYAGASNNNLYRVSASEGPTQIAPSNQGKDVVDIGDIDNDTEHELLYLDSSDNLKYIDKSGSSTTISISVGVNNGVGAGEVVNFSGTEQLLYVDGSQNLGLANSSGKTNTFSIGTAVKTRPAAADVDSDGNTEFVYVGSDNNYLNYVDDPESNSNSDPTLKVLKDASGDPVEVKPATGVLSGN